MLTRSVVEAGTPLTVTVTSLSSRSQNPVPMEKGSQSGQTRYLPSEPSEGSQLARSRSAEGMPRTVAELRGRSAAGSSSAAPSHPW